MNVWTYWAGPKPKWIDTCLRSIERCCRESKFHLLTPENVWDYVGELHGAWMKFPPGVGTDCIRAALIAQHGGLWIDADTICIKDPINLFVDRHQPNEFLYSTWNADRTRPIAGYVYSAKGHPVAQRWHRLVNAYLPDCKDIGWGDLGERALKMALAGGGDEVVWRMAIETFLPIDIDTNVERYYKKSGYHDFMTQDTIAFGLNYSWMMEHKKDMMERWMADTRDLRVWRIAAERGPMIYQLLYDTEVLNAK